MKQLKNIVSIFIILLLLCVAGCSSSSKSDQTKMNSSTSAAMDSTSAGSKEKSTLLSSEETKKIQSDSGKIAVPNQMVIYQADLQLRVKKFEQTVQAIEEIAGKYGGYIAESNVTKEGKEQLSGSIKLRIPERHFQDFLHAAEGQAVKVIQRNITGQDVTEEYVDLKARLKAKKDVEERLTSFMKKATKTEDLLKISTDLGAVQEEIESIEGKMKFLENQTSFSTVNISLYETKEDVPTIEKDKLNTWERTKKQFMKSTNALLTALSGLVVFIIGNLPVLVILSLISYLIWLYFKRRKKE